MSAPLPLTVIGGYLGAGKTTLINRVLARARGQRIAVLVNDFGELNIDAQLIAGASGDTIALTNGCVCCAIGDDLGAALAQLMARRSRLDAVLLEASGVADPVRLGSMADTWPGYTLHSVTVVADALRVHALLDDAYVGAHVKAQLCDADQVVVSKLDSIDARQHDALLQKLAKLTTAPIRPTSAFSMDAAVARRERPPQSRAHPPFQSRTFRSSIGVDRRAFERWAAGLGAEVRGKGLLRFNDCPRATGGTDRRRCIAARARNAAVGGRRQPTGADRAGCPRFSNRPLADDPLRGPT